MNLIFNETAKVDFSITIAGTQMKPTEVRLVLGDGAQLVFKASSQDGVNYSTLVTPLKEVLGSICRLRIEVLFGEKIFTPINRMISLADIEPTEVCLPAQVIPPVETVPNVEPKDEDNTPPPVEPKHAIEIPSKIEEPEEHKNAPLEVKKVVEEIKVSKPSLFHEIAATPDRGVVTIEEKVKVPGKIPSLDFDLKSIPKPIVITEKISKPEPVKTKVLRKPLKKLVEKKPTGVEIDSIKVSKSIFVESEKIPLKQPISVSEPIVKESSTPFPVIIKRKDIVYL